MSQEDRIGGNPGGGSNFIGKMDELKIYRKALTQSEIDGLYDSVKRGRHSSTGETGAVY
ncbi:LamG domain-containing protein [Paenibacillus sp. KQZ6P-2]|uniref:LamG domain-containing protein n=1 Tax=Paenibacillus mangrovi TaxID=2931978 RepID=A0A9X2B4E8_9BACL|nr:LamG domain-containing protein [Paenibacillus mangrovi]